MSCEESKIYLLQERCIRMHKERGMGKSTTNESIKKNRREVWIWEKEILRHKLNRQEVCLFYVQGKS